MAVGTYVIEFKKKNFISIYIYIFIQSIKKVRNYKNNRHFEY